MSSTSKASRIIDQLEAALPKDASFDEDNIMADERYVKKLSSMIKDAMNKGADIMQKDDGSVIITEMKPATFLYNWNEKKGRFERAKSGSRVKKRGRKQGYSPKAANTAAANANTTTKKKEERVTEPA